MSTMQQTVHSSALDNTILNIQNQLDEEHKNYMKEVIHIASSLAHDNLPHAEETSYEHHISGIRGFYTRLVNSIPLRLSGALQLLLGSLEVASFNEQISKKEKERDLIDTDKKHLQSDLHRMGGCDAPMSFSMYRKLSWLLGFSDVVLMVSFFLSLLQERYVVAIIAGIGLGSALYFLIKTTVLIYRDNPEAKNKKVLYVILFLLIVSISAFGFFRGKQVHGQDDSLAPYVYILVNMIICIATALIVYYYFPSKKEEKKQEEIQQLEKNIANKEQQIKSLDNSIEQIKSDKKTLATDKLQIRHAQQLLCNRVQAMWTEAIGTFISTNIRYRTDKSYPNCFRMPIEPLHIDNTDENINHFKIETNEN